MKKIFCFLLLAISIITHAKVITSTTTGGNWTNTATWVGGVVPGSSDTVIIATTPGPGHDVVANGPTIVNVTVNSGASMTIITMTVKGLLINNGSIDGISNASLYFTLSSGTVVSGGGSWTNYVGSIYFEGANQTIDASAKLYARAIVLATQATGGNIRVTNKGSVIIPVSSSAGITNNGSHSTTWINAANSCVNVSAGSWVSSYDTLIASDTNNTVIYSGTIAYNIKTPKNNKYYDIKIENSLAVHMLNSYTAHTVTVDTIGILNLGGDSLFLSGSWIHVGKVINHRVIVPDTGIIKIGSTIVQKVPPTALCISSTTVGGKWQDLSTWVEGFVPGELDTVHINTTGTGNVYTYTSPTSFIVVNANVSSGATLQLYAGNLTVNSVMVNNGSITGSSYLILGSNSGTVLKGSGSWTGHTGYIYFQGGNQTIDASVTINKSTGGIVLNTSTYGGNIQVTNKGSVTLSNATSGSITNNGGHSSTWINAANSLISVGASSWTSSHDTLHASDTGNTVIYTGTSAYNLKKPTSAYYNLTVNSTNTISLPAAITVTNNLSISGGTLSCGTNQITGNSTGTFSMASGTSLNIGLTTSTTNVSFPTNFTTARCSLDPNSTVNYQANTAQTVSSTPTYGNLTLATGTSSTTKSSSSTTLSVGGALTINSTVTLGGLNSGGTLNLGGNFTNNGTFTYGTSTVVLNGTAGQTLGGSTATTFYNLTVNGASGNVVTLAKNESVTQNLNVATGSLDTSTYHIN